ncbi:outer membrane protein assembly factor BamA [Solemya pervernicosa gill symbiont]|uniref:Outer membrane protein assembly factor BamA n=2 Tax=Gammaproteobacteria incertae sedis TaxID=118884 RepID=A0A1T2L7V8_9GAMM|nr:outer membrane protein assembly factor BamA [Candidatus Reidiella endopervernicosa]OOZ41188.1 outer membrane protein assembly factor BamA [Solemya pervernicosa gill symbiont]QKQ27087.1 outer membrane protein assembly factor BamA [Candidatus Reidiella endopervernicosa]
MTIFRRFLLLLLLPTTQVFAVESFEIKDIRVEGLQRISAGTVFNYLPVKVGDQLNDSSSSDSIRSLFKTGFFKDVRLEREGDVLVVFVVERPAISDVNISGNKDIETEQLLEGLKQVGLAEGRVFDRSLLAKVEQELQRMYFARGKYGVKIQSTMTPLERNRVDINIDVSEGRAARIKEINIIGNEAFDDGDLLDEFQLSTSTMFSFYTKSDQYSREKLSADLEMLRSFYLNRGYINFVINSTQVSITPDKKDIYVTINLTEGDVYTISSVKMAGDLVVPAEELLPLVKIDNGETFSRKKTTTASSAISDRLGDDGYAFANVNTIPDIDKEKKQVALTFFVDPGNRVYVRRINFIGNTKTKDEVLRREMRQIEGGWISTSKVNRSRIRLQRLNYFDRVNVETPAVPGSADQVDVNFSVDEKPSGNLMAAVGYSQTQGAIFNASITQDNFLGEGKRVSLAFNNSDVNTVYSLSYLDPYFTMDGLSLGLNASYKETDAEEANISSYTTDSKGLGITMDIPINEYDTVSLGLSYENLAVHTGPYTSTEITDFLANEGDVFDNVSLRLGWAHDTRNKVVFPTEGGLQSLNADITVPGLDLEYYTLSYRHNRYFPIAKHLTMAIKANVAYGESYGETEEFPFFRNYYAGGIRSIRGFRDNTIGPRDSSNNPLGGNLKLVGNGELIFPFPFALDSNTFRMSLFGDIGSVYGTVQDFDAEELRYSAGVAATWLSPLGPMSFSYAFPFNDKSSDETESFQFTLGSTF